MTQQITQLYELAQQQPQADFLAALERASEQQMYGAEYVQARFSSPGRAAPLGSASLREMSPLPFVPAQREVERDLAQYEQYVANREGMLYMLQQERGKMA